MILEFLLYIVVGALGSVFKGLSIMSLPVDMISALVTVIKYGTYVVGSDLMVILFGSIMCWIGIRTTVGLVIFVWKLLPFT